jgi:hypothetical protein
MTPSEAPRSDRGFHGHIEPASAVDVVQEPT